MLPKTLGQSYAVLSSIHFKSFAIEAQYLVVLERVSAEGGEK